MDIHAFRRLFPLNDEFQNDCDLFAARVKGDDDAKKKFGLDELDSFKDSPEEFHEAVRNAVEYIDERKKGKSPQKAYNIQGVNIVYDDENCLITSPENAKYSHAAGSFLKGKNSCPWCTAVPYPKNEHYWEYNKIALCLYLYKKRNGNLVDAWTIVFDDLNLFQIKERILKGERCFLQIETLENEGNSGQIEKQVRVFKEMLGELNLSVQFFYEILRKYIIKKGFKMDYDGSLIRAIIEDDLKSLQKFKPKINSRNSEGKTPLHIAVHYQKTDIVEWFLNHGANPNLGDKRGCPPHFEASEQNDSTILKILLKNGAEANHLNIYHQNALYTASQYGRMENVKILVDNGAYVECRDVGHNSPMTYAGAYGHIDIMDYFVSHGADIDNADYEGKTGLIYFVLFRQPKAVKYLLEKGADADAVDMFGKTALDYAREEGVQETIELLEGSL